MSSSINLLFKLSDKHSLAKL